MRKTDTIYLSDFKRRVECPELLKDYQRSCQSLQDYTGQMGIENQKCSSDINPGDNSQLKSLKTHAKKACSLRK